MYYIEYIRFDEVEPAAFLPILNKQTTRKHLIDHDLFDIGKVTEWVQNKLSIDASPGCRVRAIVVNEQLAGWCGIQFEEGKYEIAIVIDDSHWGLGKLIFQDIMLWARELGHTTIFIHLLHTRPEYKFLRKISKNVCKNHFSGSEFTTYELEVSY